MKSVAIIVTLSTALLGCGGKKKTEEVISGSGSPTVLTTPTGSGSGSDGSGSGSGEKPLAANEKRIGKSPYLDVVELTDKATPTAKLYELRGAKDSFSIQLAGGTDPKEVPDVTEFPLSTENHRNLNQTIVSFKRGDKTVQFIATSLAELGEPGKLPVDAVKQAFDRVQKQLLDDTGMKLDKQSDESIGGGTGRILELSGAIAPVVDDPEKPGTGSGSGSAAAAKGPPKGPTMYVKMWMSYLAKANMYFTLAVTVPPGDPLVAETEKSLKTLIVAP